METIFPESKKDWIENPDRMLKVKFGIDPTSDRLHLGHAAAIWKTREFQDKGHHIDIVLGTITGRLGDPSGQDKTRPILGFDDVLINAKRIENQIRKFFKEEPMFHFNHRFVSELTVPELLIKLASKFTVSQMLARDGFKQRMENNKPIALHEFLVPLLQGWDSVVLKSDVEIGGTDQLFNFQVARQLQESEGLTPEVCVMLPIIRGTDGRKMSKSFGNVIFLDEKPKEMFGQVMSISDDVCDEWWEVFKKDGNAPKNPMHKKMDLAFDIVFNLHGTDAALNASDHFHRVIRKDECPDERDMETVDPEPLFKLVAKARGCSGSDARRLIKAGAVKLIGVGKLTGVIDTGVMTGQLDVPNSGDVIQVGKRKFVIVR